MGSLDHGESVELYRLPKAIFEAEQDEGRLIECGILNSRVELRESQMKEMMREHREKLENMHIKFAEVKIQLEAVAKENELLRATQAACDNGSCEFDGCQKQELSGYRKTAKEWIGKYHAALDSNSILKNQLTEAQALIEEMRKGEPAAWMSDHQSSHMITNDMWRAWDNKASDFPYTIPLYLASTLPEGWRAYWHSGGITVSHPSVGGYWSHEDADNIASTILFRFAKAILEAAPEPK